jgi:protein-S-isoprenylcysteine O-methyltransferase Ste14
MQGEGVYRAMLLALLLGLMPMGLYHRLRSRTGERLSRRDEGLPIMILLRLCGVGAWLEFVAYLINPAWMAWSEVGLPGWLRSLGLPLGMIAVAWLWWMLNSLGPNLTDTVTVRANATLVTGGPYRWVRHPMYLGAELLVMAVSLITANAFIAMTGALTVAMLVLRTKTEEAKLIERFGESYRQYATRTGRFLPRYWEPSRARGAADGRLAREPERVGEGRRADRPTA